MDSLAQAGAALHLLQCLHASRVEIEQRSLLHLLAPFSSPPYGRNPYNTDPYSSSPYSPCSPLVVQTSEASTSATEGGHVSSGWRVSNSSTENLVPHSHSLECPFTPPQTEAYESKETMHSINTISNSRNARNYVKPLNINCLPPLNLDAVLDRPPVLVNANPETTIMTVDHGREIGESLPNNDLFDFLLDVDGDQNIILDDVNVNSFDKQIETASVHDSEKEKPTLMATQIEKNFWEPNDFLLAMGENGQFHGNFQTLEMETSTDFTSAKEIIPIATTKIPCENSTNSLHKMTKEYNFTMDKKKLIPAELYSLLTASLKSKSSTNPNPDSNSNPDSNLDLESYDNLSPIPKRTRITEGENSVFTEKKSGDIDQCEKKENTELNGVKRGIPEPTRRFLSWSPHVEEDKGKKKVMEENGNLSDFDEKDWAMEEIDFEDSKLPTSRSSTKLGDLAACQDKATPGGGEKKPRQKRGTAMDHASVAARNRRGKISKRIRTLQTLIPNTSSLDTAGMLEAAIKYVYHLKRKVSELSN